MQCFYEGDSTLICKECYEEKIQDTKYRRELANCRICLNKREYPIRKKVDGATTSICMDCYHKRKEGGLEKDDVFDDGMVHMKVPEESPLYEPFQKIEEEFSEE